MLVIIVAVFIAYGVLLFISFFFDPKRKESRQRRVYSIYRMLAFSTFKMSSAILIVVIVTLMTRYSITSILGLTGIAMQWQVIGNGLITAIGFVLLYIIWNLTAAQLFSRQSVKIAKEKEILQALPDQLPSLILVFGLISLEAGLLEEIFFRGIIQTNFAPYIGQSYSVLVSAILFGLGHYYQGPGGVVGTSILGVCLGLSYALTGNLLVPIIGHFLGDFGCMLLQCRQILKQKRISKAVTDCQNTK